jgi:hypothetical protein
VLDAEVNTYRPPPESRIALQPVKENRKRTREAEKAEREQAKREEECGKIASSLSDIRERMREGYTAAAGEKLKQTERKLRARADERKCR